MTPAPRSRNPFPILVVLAVLPALALGWLWRFADGRSAAATAPTTSLAASTPVTLDAPVLSVRRGPATLAQILKSEPLETAAAEFIATLDAASCAMVAVDGRLVAAHNPDVMLRPASTVKLITAAVALDVLGADFRYTTDVRGVLANGQVDGDLILVGGGDPVLSSEWWTGASQFPPFNVTSIEALAESIVAAGVTSISGGVVGDASRYDSEWYADSWAEADRFANVGPISALLANDSREAIDASSNDPAVGAAQVLIDELVERGVAVGGAASRDPASIDAPVIASIQSQPLPAILAEMLTTSDNNTAEMVLKEIGLHALHEPTRAGGLKVVDKMMAGWGVEADEYELLDGSGMSDGNRLSCQTLLTVLQHGSVDDAVGLGLAVAGQPGGTLADTFQDPPLAGVMRAKTGTLSNADGIADKPGSKALAGYVPLGGTSAVEFVLILNGEMIADQRFYRPIWAGLAEVLASYPVTPTVEDLGP